MICAGGFSFPDTRIYAGEMNGKLAEKIKAIRNASGLNQTEFGEIFQVTQSTVGRWEKGSEPKAEYLQAIADYAHTSVERLLGIDGLLTSQKNDIPVVGHVGAGAQVYPLDDYAPGGGMDYVTRPEFITGSAVAVEVRGDSLLPVAENGWRLIYMGEQNLIEEDVLNRLCVVQLSDGRMLVKRLVRGSKPQRYHLLSTNAPIIEDAEVVWAARVKAIIPT